MAKKSSRKIIEWYDELINMVEFLYLNGYSDEEVAQSIPCSVQTFKFRLAERQDLKQRFKEAKKRAITDATQALMKIAQGYHENDVYYGESLKLRVEAKALFSDLMEFVPEKEHEDFVKRANRILGEGEILKTVKKWYPPSKDAINKVLDNHKEDTWDSESRRKKIPDVKINVTLGGKTKRALKEVKPDYEVISE